MRQLKSVGMVTAWQQHELMAAPVLQGDQQPSGLLFFIYLARVVSLGEAKLAEVVALPLPMG